MLIFDESVKTNRTETWSYIPNNPYTEFKDQEKLMHYQI